MAKAFLEEGRQPRDILLRSALRALPVDDDWRRFLSPTLAAIIEDGALPEGTVRVLHAGVVLQALDAQGEPTWWEDLAEGLNEATGILGLGPRSGDGTAFEKVREVLAYVASQVRDAHTALADAGLAWKHGHVVKPEGMNPQRFYTELIAALVQEVERSARARGGGFRNDRATREQIAEELAAFFPPEDLDPGHGKRLANTIKNVLRARTPHPKS